MALAPKERHSDSFPLSSQQTRVWLDDQRFPDASYHNVALALRLDGRLDTDRFQTAWRQTVRDLDALRLIVDFEAQLQSISDLPPPVLPVVPIGAAEVDARIGALAMGSLRRRGVPCWRAELLRLSEDRHIFGLVIHRVVADPVSIVLLLEHLADLYMGRHPVTAPSFTDYLSAEAAYLQSAESNEDRAFWRRKLRADMPPLQLYGTTRADSSVGSTRWSYELSAPRARALRSLATASPFRSATPWLSQATAMATGFLALMHRASGNREVALALPVLDRPSAFARTFGPLADTVTLYAEVEDGDTFSSLGERIRIEAEAAFRHGRCLCEFPPATELATLTCLPAMPVTFGDLEANAVLRPAPTCSQAEPRIGDSRGTLALSIVDRADGTLELALDLHSRTFSDRRRTRASVHLLRMLEAMAKDVRAPIESVDLVDESERREVLLASRGPDPIEAAPDLVIQLARQAQQHPNRTAAVGPDVTLTYAELEARSNQMARRLQAVGVGRGSLVALAVPRGALELVSLLGTLKAGGAYVPVDPLHPAERIRVVLDDTAPQVLIAPRASPMADREGSSRATLRIDDLPSALDGIDPSPLGAAITPDQVAYVLFTSGSTGRPKGVQVLRSGLANFLRSMAHTPGLTERDRVLAITTTTFDIAGLELYLPLYVGATVLIVDRETATDPRLLRKYLENESVTVLQATPATWRLLLEEGWQGDQRIRMLCGGEALAPDLARKLCDRGSELWNMYGPTETTVWSTAARVRPQDERITIGRPIDSTQVYVLDSKLRLAPVGTTGEIYIGGSGVARGYLGREDLTAERFIACPFDSADSSARIYRTGDLGRLLDDGNFECLGRVDHQVKIRGYRVEIGDIESALLAAPGVKQAAVVANASDPSNPTLIGYVVGGPPNAVLFRILREKLPRYMVPSRLVRVDAFPLTTTGKVDRRALLDTEEAPVSTAGGRSPRNALEAQVARIWADLLGVDRIAADEDYFTLGATSVLVVRARARLEQELGIDLPVRAFFETPTVEQLVRQIDDCRSRSDDFEGLWKIRSGDGILPILVVHGDVSDRLLPAHLPEQQSVYGYLHQGTEGKRIRLSKVDTLAERCHAEWLEVCGRTPCAILGHSFGGLVAWHVAHLRRKAGLPVAFVGLLDSLHPQTERRNRLPGIAHPGSWYRQLRTDIATLKTLARAERTFRRGEALCPERRNEYVLAVYEQATVRYLAPPLDVDTMLFRALADSHDPADAVRWRKATSGQFEVFPVDGTHLEMVRSARHFAAIGRILREKIEALRGR